MVEGDLDLYCLDDFKRAVAAAEDTEDSLIILDLTQWYVRASLSHLSAFACQWCWPECQWRPRDGVESSQGHRGALRTLAMDKLTKPLSSLEAAFALGVSKRTMRRYISAGVVPTYRLPSGHVRIHPNVIEELTRPVGPQNKHLLIRRGWRERPELQGWQALPWRARRPAQEAPTAGQGGASGCVLRYIA